MSKYSKEFKEEALKLSDEIGVRPLSKNGYKKASKNEMNRSISLIY